MPLTLQSQLIEDVLVLRCQGRLVHGPEVEALEAEALEAEVESVAVCGPGIPALRGSDDALKRFHQSGMKVLMLPAGFHISDAGDAGVDLIQNVKQMLGQPQRLDH